MEKPSRVQKPGREEANPKKAYTSRLQKGGALLEDMRALVRSFREEGDGKHRQRIIIDNLLGKNTRARAIDVYRRAFSQRFLNGNPPEAWKIVRPLEDREIPLEILKPVYYWITARSEQVLYDFVTQEILARTRNPDQSIRVDETSLWIKKQLREQGQKWTDTVTLKVARGLLAALRDFGILEGAARKRVAPIYIPTESFAFLAYVLHSLGSSSQRLIGHSDWKLFLMETPVVERLFLDAHQHGLLRYAAAGGLYRIDFQAGTLEEMADVIAGKRTHNA
ncbi:MAG: BrxA family protein [Syntrophobacteria bacterium]